MAVITETYRELNRQLHRTRPDYGAGSATRQWFAHVAEFAKLCQASSILDYGCGKGALGRALSHLVVKNYDPAIEGLESNNTPCDLVVCTDVLEHIEPECLDDVLDDMRRCSLKAIFMTVATRPAVKFLSDGRNAHLIQKQADFWLPKIMARWDLRLFQDNPGQEFAVFAIAREAIGERAAA